MRRHLLERWKPAAAVALTAALFTPLLILGGPAFARTGAAASQYQYGGSAQYQYKIQICHFTHSRKHPAHTIRISSRAWKAHSRHGDHLGACAQDELRLGLKADAHGLKSHGKSGDHGNQGKHGGNGD